MLKFDIQELQEKSCISYIITWPNRQTNISALEYNMCPRSIDPFYVVNYSIKIAKTSWTYSTIHNYKSIRYTYEIICRTKEK